MDGDVRLFYTYLDVLLPALTSFAYYFLCVLCTNTYSFHLYSPSPPSPHIQFSMSLTLPNKALVGTSMYIRSPLQLVAERHHQNLIPHLRSRNVLRASCSYLLFSRRHHIKLHPDAVELLSTPYLPTFSRHFSHLPTRFRLLYPRGSRAQTRRFSHLTSLPLFSHFPFYLLPPTARYLHLSNSSKLSFTFHATNRLCNVSRY